MRFWSVWETGMIFAFSQIDHESHTDHSRHLWKNSRPYHDDEKHIFWIFYDFSSIPNGGCTGNAMNSGNANQKSWVTQDEALWWLRSTTYSEPNGDYHANCYLDLWHTPKNENSVTWKAHMTSGILLPFVSGVFCWPPPPLPCSQLLWRRQLSGY